MSDTQKKIAEATRKIVAEILAKGSTVKVEQCQIIEVDGEDVQFRVRFAFEKTGYGFRVKNDGKMYCTVEDISFNKKMFKHKKVGGLDHSGIAQRLIELAKAKKISAENKARRELERDERRKMNDRLKDKFPAMFGSGTTWAAPDGQDELRLTIHSLTESQWEHLFGLLSCDDTIQGILLGKDETE